MAPGTPADVLTVLATAVIVIAIVVGTRRHRPNGARGWHLLAMACIIATLPGVAHLLDVSDDIFLIVDGVGTGGSLLTGGAGIAILSRARGRAAWNATALLDYLIIVVTGSVFALDVFLEHNRAFDFRQLVSLIGCIAAIGVITLVIRMFSGRNSTFVTRCLGVAVLSAVFSGAFSALEISGGGNLSAASQILAELLVAAAALHPTMTKVTEPAPQKIPTFTLARALLLSAALLVCTADAAIQMYRSSGDINVIWLAASIGIALAIGLRVRMLLSERDEARRHEAQQNLQLRCLTRAGEQLLLTTSTQEALRIAVDIASEVLGGKVELQEDVSSTRSETDAVLQSIASEPDGVSATRIDGELVLVALVATETQSFGTLTCRRFDNPQEDIEQSRRFVAQLLNMVMMSIRRTEAEGELRRSQKLEAVSRLAGGLAHELNTPLQFIGSNIAFLEESFNELFSRLNANPIAQADELQLMKADVSDAARDSIAGLQRAAGIVQAMKTVSKASASEVTRVDINELAEQAMTLAQDRLSRVGTTRTSFDATRRALCNSLEMSEALISVLANAVDELVEMYGDESPDGLIRIETYDGDDDTVCVAISDNGRGIPAEIRDQVWEQFFTTKAVGSGTGLGLPIARSLIMQAHGTIDFTSDAGGTTFTVKLPTEA
jgi:signal transduction histidine kinase